jgi:16S rRNA (uracil1498-N3)-methyltransferase
MPSFYCPDLSHSIAQVVLSPEETHHLVHVLRCKPGDRIRLNSGRGWRAEGLVGTIHKKYTTVTIENSIYAEKPKPAFALAFSLLKNKNDEWLVEKATELGVADFFPLHLKNSVRTPSPNTITRFQATALTAIKQCDNPWLPGLHPVQDLEISLEKIRSLGYLPVLASELKPDVWLDSLPQETDICIIIGPEGGFDPLEFALLEKYDIKSIALSGNIMRAETAAITAAAQFSLLRKH